MDSKTLLESNRALRKRMGDLRQATMQESIRRSYGLDVSKKEIYDFEDPFFKWSKMREACVKLRETEAENVFQALLRSGVNTMVNSWYQLVPTNHESVMQTVISNKAIELYAPLQRAGVPKRVQKGANFQEVAVVGLDVQLTNWKFGALFVVERELVDDDQTSQILDRARDIGENMRILEDAWAFTKFIGAAGSYAGDVIPASETYTTVFSATTLKNRPSSFQTFGQTAVQDGHVALLNMLDTQGNKLLVNPNTLLVAPANKFPAAMLMNSAFYPSSATIKVGGTTTDTSLGTGHADNIMKGLYDVVESRFLPAKAWALGEAGRGIVFQRRDPLEMIQENPQSGQAFQADEYRFRSRSRFNVDWVEPRYWYLGNDGSV